MSSKGEQTLMNFFKKENIFYKYEYPMLIIEKDNKQRIWYPDFYLPEYGIIIEFFGMNGNKNYDKGSKYKKEIYKSMNFTLIPVYPKTLKKNWELYILIKIKQILKERLNTFNNRQIV